MNGIFSDSKICWDLLFANIFSDENVVGLVTNGIILKTHNGFEIKPITKNILEAATVNH